MSLGPIPVSAVWALAEREGLCPWLSAMLEAAVAHMDPAYLAYVEAKTKPSASEKRRGRRRARKGSRRRRG